MSVRVHNHRFGNLFLQPIMGLSAVVLILVVFGAIVALLAPGFARVIGWLLIPILLITAIAVLSKFTAGGIGEFPGQILLMVGVGIAFVIVLFGGALVLGLLGGSRAAAAVAVEQIDNVDASSILAAAAAPTAFGEPRDAGLLRTPAIEGEQEIPLLKRAFLEGRRPNRDDLAVLAHAALTDSTIAKLTDTISGETLLHWAAKLNAPEAAARLLDCGANPNAANGSGLRPLAACDSAYLERVQRARAPKQ